MPDLTKTPSRSTCHNWPQRLEALKAAMRCATWSDFAIRIGVDRKSLWRWRTRRAVPWPVYAEKIELLEAQYHFSQPAKKL